MLEIDIQPVDCFQQLRLAAGLSPPTNENETCDRQKINVFFPVDTRPYPGRLERPIFHVTVGDLTPSVPEQFDREQVRDRC